MHAHQENNIYPLKPHFHVEKLEYAGVYLFFLFLLQNIDRRGGSNVYPQSMFWSKNNKIGIPLRTTVLLYKSEV